MSAIDRYRNEVGVDAYERQKQARDRGVCDYCWAKPGELHTQICPNRPEDEDAAPPSQDEGLF